MAMPHRDLCAAVRQLAGALEGLGDALARNDLPAILASEPALAQASSALGPLPSQPVADPALKREVIRAHAALARCTRLGDGLMHVASCSLVAQGRAVDYARHGRTAAVPPAPALSARG